MSAMVAELYEALRKAGVDEVAAAAAARAVWHPPDIATNAAVDRVRTDLHADIEIVKHELHREMAELKSDLTWRMVVMAGVIIGAISALKIFS